METVIKFNTLHCANLIRADINKTINLTQNSNKEILQGKKWIYATLDDKQILGQDAINLSTAMNNANCHQAHYGWALDFLNKSDFEINTFSSNQESIEEIQHPESRLDHMDSVIFGDHPLRFCIIRPDSFDKLLYVVGEEDFVRQCCKETGWKIYR
ncbi:hypothetical protein [Paludibacterium sp. B53371]|uniref:hypothetical protein n=1 Tax=Paludibacterium sp. B53371 TaxID=2806263 RepID=UPI001C047CCD|nr:hypothetical protein [Paludibacterium sp. B53371]